MRDIAVHWLSDTHAFIVRRRDGLVLADDIRDI